MNDLEQMAIERLKAASDMSLTAYQQPLVICISGGKDSGVITELAVRSGIPCEFLHSHTTADAYNDLAEDFHRIPAADVEPVRRGQWISWEDADNCIPSPNRHECSVCHDAAQVLVNNIELLSNYCPNCGAKMDLEE